MEGLSHPHVNYIVFNNTIDTLEKAVKERVFFVKDSSGGFKLPPKPLSASYFRDMAKPFRKHLRKYSHYVAPMSEEDFVNSYSDGRKRRLYLKALHDNAMLGGVKRKHAYTSDFVKKEKQIKLTPRIIRPGHSRAMVSIGRWVKPIEHAIYRAIDRLFGYRTVMKGLNSQARGCAIHTSWSRFCKPVALMMDASRFDQHVSVDALHLEFEVYSLFNNNAEFKELLRWQLHNKGFGRCSDGELKYSIDGTRTSGAANTALGNVVIICALVYSYMLGIGFTPKDYAFINDGDDCGIVVERKYQKQVTEGLNAWFTTMGFTMVCEPPVYVLEEIEFCQSHPVFDGQEWLMVRNPVIAIAKDCVCIKYMDSYETYKRWISAVAQGGLSLTGRVPIWQDFYHLLYRLSIGSRPIKGDPLQDTGLSRLAAGMTRDYGEIDPLCRISFYKAFNITPCAQVIIERTYSKMLIDPTIKEVFTGVTTPGLWL
jgi:hypothetical protein